jgi:hypothetical protein
MQQNGRLTFCDRCGTSVFSKVAGEGETDGGYTRWNKFEPLPEGWDYYHGIGTVCPDCSRKYKTLVDEFMNTDYAKSTKEGK